MSAKFQIKLIISVVVLSLIVWAISCAVNPVTGKKEFMLLTQNDEIALGKQSDRDVVATYGVYQDQNLQNYINSIGKKIAKLSHRPNLDWQFRLLDSPVINAFAVPGGFVYITRGILAYLNNEAELAGVVGHEIGHVAARHSAKSYSKAMVAQLGFGIGGMLSETFRKYSGLAQFGTQMLFLKFSRDHERQADALGVEYSTKAGYDSRNMANFFVTLQRLNPQSAQGGLPGWFSTHPNPAERVQSIKKDAQKWEANVPQKQLAVNRNGYLQKINGLVFGEDPRQGYRENNMFYHPQLKFQFPVPAQWGLANTPSQVQMYNQAQDAVVFFTLAQGNSPTAAANQFLQQSGAVVQSRQNTNVNGLPAHTVISQIADQQSGSTIAVISYFIKMDQNIFVFHGFTTPDKFNAYLAKLKQPMRGFKRLTDRRKINVKPARIAIKKVTRQRTLRQALQSFGVAAADLEKIAILNERNLNDVIPANTLIKVVQK
ncbi:MAG: M48 family metalloprotease [Calditrichaeota bacterium]|nr:M48 family metalloprotease [Calditrichota bacterium]